MELAIQRPGTDTIKRLSTQLKETKMSFDHSIKIYYCNNLSTGVEEDKADSISYEILVKKSVSDRVYDLVTLGAALSYWKGKDVIYPICKFGNKRWLCGSVSIRDISDEIGDFITELSDHIYKFSDNQVARNNNNSLCIILSSNDNIIKAKSYRGNWTDVYESKNNTLSNIEFYTDLDKMATKYMRTHDMENSVDLGLEIVDEDEREKMYVSKDDFYLVGRDTVICCISKEKWDEIKEKTKCIKHGEDDD